MHWAWVASAGDEPYAATLSAPLTRLSGSGLASGVVNAATELGRKARTLPLGAVLGLGAGLAVGGALYLLMPSLRPHAWLGTLLVPCSVLIGVGIERVMYVAFGYRVGPRRRFLEAKQEADRRLERLREHEVAGVYSKERAHRLADRIATEELFGTPRARGPRGPYKKRRPPAQPAPASVAEPGGPAANGASN